MQLKILRYLFTALIGLLGAGSAYLIYSFMNAGIFSLGTLAILAVGLTLFVMSMILSLPRSQEFLEDRTGLSPLIYWIIITLLIFVGIILTYAGIGRGGTEYTDFMAQQS